MIKPDEGFPNAVIVDYTNWRGVRSTRTILPIRLWFGSNEYHPGSQWLLEAFDFEKDDGRVFAMAQIHSWVPAHYSNANFPIG